MTYVIEFNPHFNVVSYRAICKRPTFASSFSEKKKYAILITGLKEQKSTKSYMVFAYIILIVDISPNVKLSLDSIRKQLTSTFY